jgi:hypothetical protein
MATINTDVAQTLDITCRRGDTFAIDITFRDSSNDNTAIPITSPGYDFHMHVRASDQDQGTPIIGDDVSGAGSAGNATLDNDTAGISGKLSIVIPDDVMINVPGGNYVYDIQAAKSDGSVQTWVKGAFTVNEDVTHYATP